MAFYYKPPRGMLSFAKLEHGAKTRVQFLLGIYNCNGNMVLMKDLVEQTVEDSEWFIEGGKKDCISHYFCRLACSQIPEMAQFFLHAETTLFRYRVTCMREEELLQTIKQVEKFHKLMVKETNLSKHLQQTFDTINALKKCHDLVDIVREYVQGSNLILHVPFLSVINLVKYRKVVMQRGFALVPVTSLLEILVAIFKDVLQYGIKLAMGKYNEAKEDIRIRRLMLQIKAIYLGRFPSLTSISSKFHLRCDDIDHASQGFPLCMRLLHHTLRNKHRLTHSARIQYTLFLKECGLPVNEAILFWQREYSQPAQNSTCTHRWNKDGRRYTYSIRHLYGLEGSRTNYRGHNCAAIQDFHVSSNQEGGCPFKHMDVENLAGQLLKEDLSGICQHEIMEKALRGEYRAACQLYLRGKISTVQDIEETVYACPSCEVKHIKVENEDEQISVQEKSSDFDIESVRLDNKKLKICDIKSENNAIKEEGMDISDGTFNKMPAICDIKTENIAIKGMNIAGSATTETSSSDLFMSSNCIKTKCLCQSEMKMEAESSSSTEEGYTRHVVMKAETKFKPGTDTSLCYDPGGRITKRNEPKSTGTREPKSTGTREKVMDDKSACVVNVRVNGRKRCHEEQSARKWDRTIHAPVDYYESYCQMLNGLR